MDDDRVPFQVTAGGALYDRIERLPVAVMLEDFRSLYNVGSMFRTADAAAIERLVLCGITGKPPQAGIAKTALGAQDTVAWEYVEEARAAALGYQSRGYEVAALETSVRSVDLYDWVPRFPVLLLFG